MYTAAIRSVVSGSGASWFVGEINRDPAEASAIYSLLPIVGQGISVPCEVFFAPSLIGRIRVAPFWFWCKQTVIGDDDRVERFVPGEVLFKGRHFDVQIIILCVSWYASFKFSLRDLVIMMADRGIPLARTTILRWIRATCRNSRSAGADTLVLSADLGGWTRPI
jgi:hypothetical protein